MLEEQLVRAEEAERERLANVKAEKRNQSRLLK